MFNLERFKEIFGHNLYITNGYNFRKEQIIRRLISRNIIKNMILEITRIKCQFYDLPTGFEGCRILHISDLHNCNYGEGQKNLIKLTEQLQPDYIFMTGDICDEYHRRLDSVKEYLKGICRVAPIYYVTGNHEWIRKDRGEDLFAYMKSLGIHILHDQMIQLERNGDCIQLIGTDDPYRPRSGKIHERDRVRAEFFLKDLALLCKERKRKFTILLSHRPEFIHFYAKAQIQLVFAGHAHGGLVRIPGIGGIIAPHQGLFPKYTEGVVEERNTKMVISRGMGNSGVFFPD